MSFSQKKKKPAFLVKIDSLPHFHSRNVYFYIHHMITVIFRKLQRAIFFTISGLTPR